jgi:hypothetical protein
MPKKLRRTIDQLKEIVDMTGTSGEWQDKGAGHWQCRANDGSILNWWQSSGTLNFQGPQQERQEFEQILDLAVAKLFSEQTPTPPAANDRPRQLPPVSSIPLGRYRHYKGNDYEVIGVARHSETLEELVVYRALYADHGLWVRPLAMFTEPVTVQGKPQPRFHFIGS